MANGNMDSGDLGGVPFDPGRQVDREVEAPVRKPARVRRGGARMKRFGRRARRRMR
jgi:hypothetical protein